MANAITKDEVEALLSRPLTSTEETNFDLYLDIAKLRVNDLVCFDITDSEQLAELPSDLKLVWARFFGIMSTEASEMQSSGVASKRVEDFQISYLDSHSVLTDLIDKNRATLAKYSKCGSGIIHGRTIFDFGDFDDCF